MAFRRFLFLFIVLGYCLCPVFGQELTVPITGRIVGPNQQPIQGVNIQVKNSQTGTYSDQKGRFRLRLKSSENLVLIFSMLNYEKYELSVSPNQKGEIIQVMKPVTFSLPMVEITEQRKTKQGTVNIDPLLARNLANTGSGSVEQLVKRGKS